MHLMTVYYIREKRKALRKEKARSLKVISNLTDGQSQKNNIKTVHLNVLEDSNCHPACQPDKTTSRKKRVKQ